MMAFVGRLNSDVEPPQFVEREAYEKGFAEVFARQILPGLASLEKERLALRRAALVRGAIPGLALVATISAWVWIALLPAPAWVGYVPIVGILALVFLGRYAYRPATQFADRSRELIMGPVCRFIGDLSYERCGGFDLRRFVSSGMISHYNIARVEDVFSGRHLHTRFQMADVMLERRAGRHSGIVFWGILLAIEMPHIATARILIARDRGKLGNKIGEWLTAWKGLTRVVLLNEEFESKFAIYAEDAEEARRVLTPEFLDTMMTLAKAHDDSAIRAGLVQGRFLLALPLNRDLFEPRSVFRSVYGCTQSIHELLREITVAHRFIDCLKGTRSQRLT